MKAFAGKTLMAIWLAWVALTATALATWAGWVWLVPEDSPMKVAVNVVTTVELDGLAGLNATVLKWDKLIEKQLAE